MPLLTPEEAAAELAISTKTLRRLTQSGALAYVNIGMGTERESRRYDRADIEAFVREHRVRIDPAAHSRSTRRQASSAPNEVFDIGKLREELKRDKAAKRGGKL